MTEKWRFVTLDAYEKVYRWDPNQEEEQIRSIERHYYET